jgi:hypothetical protein
LTYSILLSSHKLLKVLGIAACLAVAFAFFRPRWSRGFFRRMESDFRGLARDRRKAVLAAALFPMIRGLFFCRGTRHRHRKFTTNSLIYCRATLSLTANRKPHPALLAAF